MVRLMRFLGMSLSEVLRLDIGSFAAILGSMERLKADERLDRVHDMGLAFGGGEKGDADRWWKEQQAIISDQETNDAGAFANAVGAPRGGSF